MEKQSDKRVYKPIESVDRVEFPCECKKGYYRYAPDGKRIQPHNQMQHNCTSCGAIAYFTIPYPALRYTNRIFVDWNTIKGNQVSFKNK